MKKKPLASCLECSNPVSRHGKKFCSRSCAGKFNYRTSESVRAAIALGTRTPGRGDAISRGKTGKKRPDIRGANHFNWRGGVGARPRARVEYREWRAAVLERDGHTCVRCTNTQDLIAHHVVRWSEDSSLRYAASNGETLCRSCHSKHHYATHVGEALRASHSH